MYKPEMKKVKATTFRRGGGDQKNRPDALPVHNVTFSQNFYIAEEPVTSSAFAEFYLEKYQQESDTEDYQGYVIGVSWFEADEFCQWLSDKTGDFYRLPTEAEWEYCARNSKALGLDRMCDLNLREWCFDWYDVYEEAEVSDPAGPDEGLFKVVRGGFLDNPSRFNNYYQEPWARGSLPPNYRHFREDKLNQFGRHNITFRVVKGSAVKTNGKKFQPLLTLNVKQNPPLSPIRNTEPYFRKRYLFPTPPDNATSEENNAFGLNPLLRHHNHSPGFDVAPNGDLLVSIYSSYFEYDAEVGLMGARLKYGADEWEMPDIFLNPVGVNDHAPLLFTDNDGTIYHFWGWPELENAFPFQYTYSRDNGETWSPIQFPKFIEKAEEVMSQPINTVVHAKDGYYYVACDVKGKAASVLWRSKDLINWEVPQGITGGRHSTVVELKDGRLLAMGGKNSNLDGFMPQSISADRGDSWDISVTPFAPQSSGQRPCIIRLASGRLFMCGDFQNKQGERAPDATDDQWGSYAAYSEDDGQTWQIKKLWGTQHKKQDSKQLGGAHTIGYSVCRQSPDGLIHVITSNNRPCLHFAFNEAWLLADTSDEFPSDEQLMANQVKRIDDITIYKEEYENGNLKCTYSGGIAADGRFLFHGEEKWFYPSGQLMTECHYDRGEKIGRSVYYDEEGNKIWEWDYQDDGLAIYRTYYPNQQLKSEGSYRNRVAQGVAKSYRSDGRLIAEVEFVNGKIVKA